MRQRQYYNASLRQYYNALEYYGACDDNACECCKMSCDQSDQTLHLSYAHQIVHENEEDDRRCKNNYVICIKCYKLLWSLQRNKMLWVSRKRLSGQMSNTTSADDEQRANIGLKYIIQKDYEYLERNRNQNNGANNCRNWIENGYCSYGFKCRFRHI